MKVGARPWPVWSLSCLRGRIASNGSDNECFLTGRCLRNCSVPGPSRLRSGRNCWRGRACGVAGGQLRLSIFLHESSLISTTGILCGRSARLATITCRSLSVAFRSRPRQRRRSSGLLMVRIPLSGFGLRSRSTCAVCMRLLMLETRRRRWLLYAGRTLCGWRYQQVVPSRASGLHLLRGLGLVERRPDGSQRPGLGVACPTRATLVGAYFAALSVFLAARSAW